MLWFTVLDIECDRLKLVNYGSFWKKKLEISSFYTYASKTTIIWGTVPEIRSETDRFALLTPSQPRKSKFWKTEKSISRCHHFKHVCQKSWSYAILLYYTTILLYRRKKWHIEVGAPPKKSLMKLHTFLRILISNHLKQFLGPLTLW